MTATRILLDYDHPPHPQHESARALLTKYSHEKEYRLRESLATSTSAENEGSAELPQPTNETSGTL